MPMDILIHWLNDWIQKCLLINYYSLTTGFSCANIYMDLYRNDDYKSEDMDYEEDTVDENEETGDEVSLEELV